jgi:hypothetical protein
MNQRVIAVVAAMLVIAGSVGGGSLSATAMQASPSAASSPAPTALPPYNPTIDPADFVPVIDNPYFPLTPGTTFIFEGTRDGQPRRDEVTITSETKVIMGVTCMVVRDVATANDVLMEKTTDWYAQDSAGNVWYFGEDTAEYTNGAVSSTAGTWMAGVDGALPGYIMTAKPQVGEAYRQEYYPGVAEDFATVLQIDASVSTPAGDYTKVVVTKDADLLDATKLHEKSYAPGIGFVHSVGSVNGHQEELWLSSIMKSA